MSTTPVHRVAVLGHRGKMGTAAVKAITDAPDMELVCALGRGDDLQKLVDSGADIAVDLTVPDQAPHNAKFCVEHGIHAVIGTTGWDETRLTQLREQLAAQPDVGVLIAPNFAIGAVLAMRFAAVAAKYFESAEVVELHHPNKVDAPSGTAQHTAHAIGQARQDADLPPMPDATETQLPGARGAEVAGVPVHAVRLRGLVAHEEILFGNEGEMFTIRHDSFDRVSFMPGVLAGVRTVGSRPGLTVGLDKYLDLG